ncbi:MAG: glucosyl-3-phosphoglycerate synthase, partial [Actinomycetota bacterium]
SAGAYDAAGLLEWKSGTVSVMLPARTVARTLPDILDHLLPHERSGLIDELVVVDSASPDGTAEAAREKGAQVLQRDELMPEYGASLGKGDGIWRGLSATTGDIVVLLDTDTKNFGSHFLFGLLGPLFHDPSLQFVKGAFRRLLAPGGPVEQEGGRVTELVARPILNLYRPALTGFMQPLAGEFAARRGLLEDLPFPVGYGVEIGMLIDTLERVGLDRMAQVNLGSRRDEPKSLADLSAMSYVILAAMLGRAGLYSGTEHAEILLARPTGVDVEEVALIERPPLSMLRRAGRSHDVS